MVNFLKRYLPILEWGSNYKKTTLVNDLIVGVIVTMMLIPQSLAYTQLAGLPPEVGLYASIAQLIFYAIFGTSRVLAVGPVAVASLMTATAIGKIAAQGTPEYIGAALAPLFSVAESDQRALIMVVVGLPLMVGFAVLSVKLFGKCVSAGEPSLAASVSK